MYSDKKTLSDFMDIYRHKYHLDTLEKPPAPTGRIHYTGRPWKTKKVNDESARRYELHCVAYRLYCDRWYIEQRLRRIEKVLEELNINDTKSNVTLTDMKTPSYNRCAPTGL